MSTEVKKGYGSTLALIVLGMLALYLGARWLVVLVPAALFFWYSSAGIMIGRSRN